MNKTQRFKGEKMIRKLMNEKGGLSLLEVMVSMVILAFGILSLAPLIVVSMYGNSYSNDLTVANAIAQEEIEQLKNLDAISPLPFHTLVSNMYGKYVRNTWVNDVASDSTIPPGVYKIKVQITWVDHKNLSRQVDYYSYKMK